MPTRKKGKNAPDAGYKVDYWPVFPHSTLSNKLHTQLLFLTRAHPKSQKTKAHHMETSQQNIAQSALNQQRIENGVIMGVLTVDFLSLMV